MRLCKIQVPPVASRIECRDNRSHSSGDSRSLMVSKKLQWGAGVQVGNTVFVPIHWDEEELERVLKQ
jgi:hypothetical protein